MITETSRFSSLPYTFRSTLDVFILNAFSVTVAKAGSTAPYLSVHITCTVVTSDVLRTIKMILGFFTLYKPIIVFSGSKDRLLTTGC